MCSFYIIIILNFISLSINYIYIYIGASLGDTNNTICTMQLTPSIQLVYGKKCRYIYTVKKCKNNVIVHPDDSTVYNCPWTKETK